MKYCTNCGAAVEDTANFCSSCGQPFATVTSNYVTGVLDEPEDLDEGYRVILFSRGSCKAATAREVIADLLGYSLTTVKDLMDEMPVEIADELTELQAVVIAQALAEYGMEVTIVDQNNRYVDFTDRASNSVFDTDGSLIADALAIFATLSAANRVHRYRKYKKPSLLSLLFKPKYARREPVHVRRNVSHDPESRRRISIQNQPRPRNNQRPQNQLHNMSNNAQQKPAQQNSLFGSSNSKPNQNSNRGNNQKPAQNAKPQTQSQQKPASQSSSKPASQQTNNKPSTQQANNKPQTGSKPSSHSSSSHNTQGKPGRK